MSSGAIGIDVNGHRIEAFPGETVAAVLLRAGIGYSGELSGRGLFCGMGSCFECHAEIDGRPLVRTCMTTVRNGMRIRTAVDEAVTS